MLRQKAYRQLTLPTWRRSFFQIAQPGKAVGHDLCIVPFMRFQLYISGTGQAAA